jgi:hypothetical protein
MRKLVFASLSAMAIGFAFAPGAMAAPANPAGISEAVTSSSPVVKAWWYRGMAPGLEALQSVALLVTHQFMSGHRLSVLPSEWFPTFS